MRYTDPTNRSFDPTRAAEVLSVLHHEIAGAQSLAEMLEVKDLCDPAQDPPDHVDNVEDQLIQLKRALQGTRTSFEKLVVLSGLQETD